MRSKAHHLSLVSFPLLIAIALVPIGCRGSGTVTGPSGGSATAVTNISGVWSGSYISDDFNGCGASTTTATFHQDGATVTGPVSTGSSCGVSGYFKGTVNGNMVLGTVGKAGCVGGGASGTINGNEMSLSIGDMTKPLVTGDRIIMYGGVVTLHR